jgi:hypothetical protein
LDCLGGAALLVDLPVSSLPACVAKRFARPAARGA